MIVKKDECEFNFKFISIGWQFYNMWMLAIPLLFVHLIKFNPFFGCDQMAKIMAGIYNCYMPYVNIEC